MCVCVYIYIYIYIYILNKLSTGTPMRIGISQICKNISKFFRKIFTNSPTTRAIIKQSTADFNSVIPSLRLLFCIKARQLVCPTIYQ